jgi:uncharacterized membrane protein YhaH (DUF805 family)
MFYLLTLVSYVAVAILGSILGDTIGSLLILALVLAFFVPGIAVGIRRLHDTGRSGWWLLISLVPLVGGIILLVFLVTDGTKGPNEYGPDPKGGDADLAERFA